MKKFLVAILFIVPIIVMAALSLTGTIIASATPINAREIALRDSDNHAIDADTVVTIEPNDHSKFIIIDILPTLTYDDSISYRVDDSIAEAGNIRLERQGSSNRYSIIPLSSGVARVIINPKTNINISASFTVVVLGRNIKEMRLFDDTGQEVSAIELYAPIQIYSDIYPIEALKDHNTNWVSDNESVVRVSANGKLYPISQGIANVQFIAVDKDELTHIKTLVVDTTKALIKTDFAYTAGEISAEWVKNNIVIDSNAIVADKGSGNFVVTANGQNTAVRVLPCDIDSWGFLEYIDTIYTNNGHYFVDVGYLDFERQKEKINCTYAVSNPLSVKVDKGRLIPYSAGITTLIASYKGQEKTLSITVRNKPSLFNLRLNSEDNKLGIKQDRVWGNLWYNDSMQLINTYQFGAISQGINLYWEVCDNNLASINQDGMLTFHPDSYGQSVTVTATLLVHNHKTKTRRSYTFKMHDSGDTININNSQELYHATNTRGRDIALQDNIYIDAGVVISASLYGNGFMISGAIRSENNMDNNILTIEQQYISQPDKPILLENFTIEGCDSYKDAADKGIGIRMAGVEITPIIIRYAIIQFLDTACYVREVQNLTIEGCIIGDCFSSSLNLTYNPPANQYVRLKNNILKASQGPCIYVINDSLDIKDTGKNIMPYMTIEGFLDFYNWKTPDQIGGLLSGLNKDLLGFLSDFGVDVDNVMREIGGAMKKFFSRKDNQYLTYVDPITKEKYVSLGVLMLGMFNKLDISRLDVKDDGLTALPMVLTKVSTDKNDEKDISFLLSLIEALVKPTLGMTLSNPSYILSYEFDGNSPRNKPGDPVPQSKEVFDKLRG